MKSAWVWLSILSLTAAPGAAAELDVPPKVGSRQAWPVQSGPLGTCRIYLQGRYAACELTTEPACQRLSEVWHKPRSAIASRRWYALPQGLAWDLPRC